MDATSSLEVLTVEQKLAPGQERLKRINEQLFRPQPVEKAWIEQQASDLLQTVNLPVAPIQYFSSMAEAQVFAARVDTDSDWATAWTPVRNRALIEAGITADVSLIASHPWNKARNMAEDIFADAFDYGQLGRDARRRAASWLQYFTIDHTTNKHNPLEPFMNVYEKGAALLGVYEGKFGVYLPQQPKGKA